MTGENNKVVDLYLIPENLSQDQVDLIRECYQSINEIYSRCAYSSHFIKKLIPLREWFDIEINNLAKLIERTDISQSVGDLYLKFYAPKGLNNKSCEEIAVHFYLYAAHEKKDPF